MTYKVIVSNKEVHKEFELRTTRERVLEIGRVTLDTIGYGKVMILGKTGQFEAFEPIVTFSCEESFYKKKYK